MISPDDGMLPWQRISPRDARYPVRHALREATMACHERVDAAYGGFALSSPGAYRSFLIAHARALVPLERAVSRHTLWHEWQPRRALLLADLAALGAVPPSQPDIEIADAAAGWGTLYVLEGSRLGGGILAKRVASGLPAAYLSARHAVGGWDRFTEALEQAGEQAGDQAGEGAAWRSRAIAGARAAFARFEQAAGGGCR
jgi:heme oxygenase